MPFVVSILAIFKAVVMAITSILHSNDMVRS